MGLHEPKQDRGKEIGRPYALGVAFFLVARLLKNDMEDGPELWKILLILGINLYISLKLVEVIFNVVLMPTSEPLLWADGSLSW